MGKQRCTNERDGNLVLSLSNQARSMSDDLANVRYSIGFFYQHLQTFFLKLENFRCAHVVKGGCIFFWCTCISESAIQDLDNEMDGLQFNILPGDYN